MPSFDIILTRDTTESVNVTVIAANEDDAQETALESVPEFGWERDDNFPQDAYITNVEKLNPTRADLFDRPAWQDLEKDSAGNPCVWDNRYACDDDHPLVEWTDQWSCQCSDDCPECGNEVEATYCGESTASWIGPTDEAEIALWKKLPEAT